MGALISALAPPIRKVSKLVAHFDPASVQTHLQEVDRIFRTASDGEELKGIDWSAVLGQIDASNAVSQWRTAARDLRMSARASSARHRAFERLLKAAEDAIPGAPILVMAHFDLPGHYRRICEPLDLLREASRSRGERRARASLRALREVCEMLYDPYLRATALLGSVALKRRPSRKLDRFGTLVAHADSVLRAWPGLCDRRLSTWRNAACHAHWNYDASSDRVFLWDINSPPVAVPVDDLLDAATNAWALAGPCYFFTAQHYIVRGFMLKHGFARRIAAAFKFLPQALAGNSGALAKAEAAWEQKLATLRAPLEAAVQGWEAAETQRQMQRAQARNRAPRSAGP